MSGDQNTPPPDWSSVTVEPRCPQCGYNLRGLAETRCPECGREFDWAAVMSDAEQRLDHALFEYQWRKRPIRSYCGTVARSLLPWRFWRRMAKSGRPRLMPLLAMLPITWAICALLLLATDFAGHHSMVYALRVAYGVQTSWPFYWPWHSYSDHIVVMVLLLALIWLCVAMCSQALARKGFGQGDVLRLLVLSAIPAVCASLAFSMVSTFIEPIEILTAPPFWLRRWMWIPAMYGNKLCILFFAASFCIGASRYLGIRRGWLWGLIVLGLTVAILTSLMYSVSVHYYGSLANPALSLLGRWWWGYESLIGKIYTLSR